MYGPKERKYLLSVAGYTPARLARESGCDPSLVYHVIEGRKKNRQVQERIAALCGIAVERLFGSCLGRPRILADELAEVPTPAAVGE